MNSIIKRPSLVVGHNHDYEKLYVYFIFTCEKNRSIEIFKIDNLKAIETNIDRAKQLAFDIIEKQYKSTRRDIHNVIVKLLPGVIDLNNITMENINEYLVGGCIRDQHGSRFISKKSVVINGLKFNDI